jgi:hypothetical protein
LLFAGNTANPSSGQLVSPPMEATPETMG